MTLKYIAGGAAMSVIAFSISGVAEAQVTTSSVKGQVTDEAGAPITGAVVSVTNPATGFSRTTTTGVSGTYSIRSLPVSAGYEVSVVSDDHQNETVEGVALSLGDATQLNFSLTGGDARTLDTIVVTASALDTIEVAVGPSATFGTEVLENAPTLNRNITDVVRLDPRVFVDESRGDINPIQCAGRNPRFNLVTLDGVQLNDGFGLNASGFPTERPPFPFDATEQVAVELAPFDVEYGGFTACNINVVTKSGTNEFHGIAFFDYTSNDLQGDPQDLDEDFSPLAEFDEQRFGIQIDGPIIKDTLFFSAAYEGLRGANNFSSPIRDDTADGITQSELDEIAQIARDVYGYEVGGVPDTFDNEDDKLLLKLDWNINDAHRAAFTYNYNDGFNTIRSDGDTDEFEFSDHLYERGTKLQNYIGQVYSDWTDNFSTEIRLGYVDVDGRQVSNNGGTFPEFTIETGDVDVYFGNDDSRQANALDYTILNFAAKGFYSAGIYDLTFGYERQEYDIFNLFVQHTLGEYDFENIEFLDPVTGDTVAEISAIEAFRRGLADNVDFNNSPTLNPNDAAADWGYAINTVYAQNEFDLTDTFSMIVGARYDFWQTDEAPAENAEFLADYGFSNSQTLDGASLFQPRIGFTWEPTDTLSVRGGLGRYSGGDPNVWLSNTYSANNVNQFGARDRSLEFDDRITLGPGQTVEDALAATGDVSILDAPTTDVNGVAVPTSLVESVQTGTGSNFEINYLDPNFDIPSEWKLSLGATYIADFGEGPLGGEYILNGDLLFSQGENSAIIQRGDLVESGALADNGAPLFDSDRVAAFVLTNARDEANQAFNASVSIAKYYDNGFDWSLGYSYNDSKDVQPMTSSVAFSNYTNRAFFNPQADELATSNYNIEHRFVAFANYEHAFFGDYMSRISAVGIANSGEPYSLALQDSGFFNFTPFIDDAGVLQSAAERNSQEGSWWSKVDLRLEQELPGAGPDHKTSFFVGIDNFTNLLNSDWGVLEEPSFPNVVEINEAGELQQDAEGINVNASSWEIRMGVTYEF